MAFHPPSGGGGTVSSLNLATPIAIVNGNTNGIFYQDSSDTLQNSPNLTWDGSTFYLLGMTWTGGGINLGGNNLSSINAINNVSITQPATGSVFTLLDGKTFTVNNSITLAGTDSRTYTFPTTNATIARTDAAQTFTGIQTIPQVLNADNNITATGNAATVTRSNRNNVVTNNSAATLTITLSTTGATAGDMLLVQVLDASAAAQTITWVNTENSTVSVPTTSNGSTTLPLTVGFKWNPQTSKWRCIASA